MSVRLSEFAKELGTTKKELFEKLPALGFELKKSLVDIEDTLANEIRAALKRTAVKFEPVPKKVHAPRPPRSPRPKKAVAPSVATAEAPVAEDEPVSHEAAPDLVPAVENAALSAPNPVGVRPATSSILPLPSAAHLAPGVTPRLAAEGPRAPAVTGDEAADPAVVAFPPPGTRPVTPSAPTAPRPESPRVQRAYTPPAASRAHSLPEQPRALPGQPRTTPKAPRPTSPRPMGRGAGRRSGSSSSSTPAPAVATPGGIRTDATLPPPPSIVPQGPLKPVTLSEGVTVKEFAEKLNLKSRDVIKRLMDRGTFATINQSLDKEIATQLARDFAYEARIVSFEEESVMTEVAAEVSGDLVPRPPVVTVMGHVDHGKTSLLDAIRETNVASREAGQITQHIGAYQTEKKDRKITFLDTPGHEAFALMRARGAKVTDIVVLVVAADDGVMPQTVEAIHHAKAAGVPIIVAINKIDLPNANPDRVMQMLSDHGLQAEAWGGDTVVSKISARKRIGIDELLDLILLVADLQDLKVNPRRSATGVVLEAKLDRGRGAVATVLVQAGTLRAGDPFIAGAVNGKVRAMFDDRGHRLDEATPAMPVEVLGLQAVPRAGDAFQVVTEEWRARQIGSFRQARLREQTLAKSSRLTLDALYKQIADGEVRELPIVLKGDVQGSVEALSEMLLKLATDKVKIRILHSGAGAITETDVLLASSSNAVMVGFNVRPERKARELAEQEQVDIRLHTVIYNVTNEIKAAMQGMLEPTFKEVTLGRAEVRQVFRIPKIGAVAGCHVQEGRIVRDCQVRLLRDNVVVHEGKLASLRRVKEDAAEVRSGYECGMSFANYQDLKEGDVIEAFKMEQIRETA